MAVSERPELTPIPYEFTDELSGNISSYVRERKLTSDFLAHIRSHIGSFVKVSATETRWLNSQTDADDEFIHSRKTIFGTIKSVGSSFIEVDAISGEIDHSGEKRSPLATGVHTVYFRHEQYDFGHFREIFEMQELSIEGKNLIGGTFVVNKQNCA